MVSVSLAHPSSCPEGQLSRGLHPVPAVGNPPLCAALTVTRLSEDWLRLLLLTGAGSADGAFGCGGLLKTSA